MIDELQYEGECLYRRRVDVRQRDWSAGSLSYNFLMLARFVCFVMANNTKLQSITIELRPSNMPPSFQNVNFELNRVHKGKILPDTFKGGPQRYYSSFNAHHLEYSLKPLLSLRNVPEFIIGGNLAEKVEWLGLTDYIDGIAKTVTSKKPYRGDVHKMLLHLKEFYLAFGPYLDPQKISRLRNEMNQDYASEDKDYLDLQYLDNILNGVTCRATFAALRYRIISRLTERLENIQKKRERVGDEYDDEALWTLFESFKQEDVAHEWDLTYAQALNTLPVTVLASKPDPNMGDDKLYDRTLALREVLVESEKGKSNTWARLYREVLKDMDGHIERIEAAKGLVEKDIAILNGIDESVPGFFTIPETGKGVRKLSAMEKFLDKLVTSIQWDPSKKKGKPAVSADAATMEKGVAVLLQEHLHALGKVAYGEN